MSSPIGNKINFNTNTTPSISDLQPRTIQQKPEEQKAREGEIDELKEGFQNVQNLGKATGHEVGTISIPGNRLNNLTPPNTLPTMQFIALLLEMSVANLHRDFPKHLQNLARKFHRVCTYGLLTQNRANNLSMTVDLSNDFSRNEFCVCLNFIHKLRGIPESLTNGARGGLSVSLERGYSDELRLKAPNFSKEDEEELAERAHQTILIGIYPIQREKGYATMELIQNEGKPFEEPHMSDIRACVLNDKDSVGSNETSTSFSIAPSNFNFIIVPERLMPLVERYLEKVKVPCVVYAVPSTSMRVEFNRTQLVVSCPDYADKLRELIKDGCLTHVLRDKSKKAD